MVFISKTVNDKMGVLLPDSGPRCRIRQMELNKNKNNNKAGRGQTDCRQQTDGSSHTMRNMQTMYTQEEMRADWTHLGTQLNRV